MKCERSTPPRHLCRAALRASQDEPPRPQGRCFSPSLAPLPSDYSLNPVSGHPPVQHTSRHGAPGARTPDPASLGAMPPRPLKTSRFRIPASSARMSSPPDRSRDGQARPPRDQIWPWELLGPHFRPGLCFSHAWSYTGGAPQPHVVGMERRTEVRLGAPGCSDGRRQEAARPPVGCRRAARWAVGTAGRPRPPPRAKQEASPGRLEKQTREHR